MKTLSIIFCLVVFTRMPAQIVLEHTYPGEARRVKLEKSGEKYYRYDNVNQRVALYNSDHTLWQEIPFPDDPSGTVERVFDVSETKIIPDKEIEVMYLFNAGVDGMFLRIMNETGKIYLDLTQIATFEVSMLSGHPTKLITNSGMGSSQVIAVPSLLIEFTFPSNNVRRMLLDNGEVKYLYADSLLRIFNSDFSLYKNVALPGWFKSGIKTVVHVSQQKVLADQKLEILLRRNQGGALLINEDGLELKRSVSGINMDVSDIPFQSAKLLLDDSVFALPGLTLEHIYTKFYPFRVSVESGPIYLMGFGDSLRYFNNNHQLIANIRMPHKHNYFVSNLTLFSEKIFPARPR